MKIQIRIPIWHSQIPDLLNPYYDYGIVNVKPQKEREVDVERNRILESILNV